jgi:hypothetical protein
MSADERRERRMAENEALAREVNERVGEVAASWYGAEEQLEFVCECSLDECSDRVRLRMAEYSHVRSSPLWFVMMPQHFAPDLELEVERVGGYLVAEKIGPGADIADQTA